RDHHVVDRLIEARPGVDLATRRLDGASDLARSAPRRSLEEHVLVQVREPGFVQKLVGAADPYPYLKGGHGGGVAFLDEDGEAVLQTMAHSVSGPFPGRVAGVAPLRILSLLCPLRPARRRGCP